MASPFSSVIALTQALQLIFSLLQQNLCKILHNNKNTYVCIYIGTYRVCTYIRIKNLGI